MWRKFFFQMAILILCKERSYRRFLQLTPAVNILRSCLNLAKWDLGLPDKVIAMILMILWWHTSCSWAYYSNGRIHTRDSSNKADISDAWLIGRAATTAEQCCLLSDNCANGTNVSVGCFVVDVGPSLSIGLRLCKCQDPLVDRCGPTRGNSERPTTTCKTSYRSRLSSVADYPNCTSLRRCLTTLKD